MDLIVLAINKLRGRPSDAPLVDPDVPKVTPVLSLTPAQKSDEARNLALLEPSTRDFARSILIWARANGIPALLGETYRSREDQAAIPAGRTAITPGQLSWHQVGRAFHLVIKDSRGQLDRDAYRRVGNEVEKRGGVWLGRAPIKTPRGPVLDLAHYEYHPGLVLWQYRKSPLAARELALAERRAARYG